MAHHDGAESGEVGVSCVYRTSETSTRDRNKAVPRFKFIRAHTDYYMMCI
jgi:hypothetical protein